MNNEQEVEERVGTTAGSGTADTRRIAAMGLTEGLVVQELGWDADVDEEVRHAIMDAVDADLVYDPIEAADVVLLWWRDEDGDLVDGLMDALRDLGGSGHVWLFTPKVGRPGYVDPADIAEGAVTAGLVLANSAKVSDDWQAQKVVRPKAGRR